MASDSSTTPHPGEAQLDLGQTHCNEETNRRIAVSLAERSACLMLSADFGESSSARSPQICDRA